MQDGSDSVSAVKLTSTENVSAGSVAFRASLGPRKRLPVGVYAEELCVTARYKAQCRLASYDHLNARCAAAVSLSSPPRPSQHNNMLRADGATWSTVGCLQPAPPPANASCLALTAPALATAMMHV